MKPVKTRSASVGGKMKTLVESGSIQQVETQYVASAGTVQIGLGFGFNELTNRQPLNRIDLSDGLGLGENDVHDCLVGVDQKSLISIGNLSQDTNPNFNKAKKGTLTEKEHPFSTGDFVWGNIRGNNFWPGRIYDPSHASDYAAKFKEDDDTLLVAYFGDRSFSWCDPSQLDPFEENFELFSKQSNSKNFLNATEVAIDEFGKAIESEMTCRCRRNENRHIPLAENSGIKKDIFVPEGGTGRFCITRYRPAELIENLSDMARNASENNILELTAFKGWLSAFYHAKGGYCLPIYHELGLITDLEETRLASGESSGCRHVRISEEKLDQRRKRKSIAELMAESTYIDVSAEQTDEKMDSDDLANNAGMNFPLRKRRVRKPTNSDKRDSPVANGGASAMKNEDVGEATYGTKRGIVSRERKISKYLSPPYTTILNYPKTHLTPKLASDLADASSHTTSEDAPKHEKKSVLINTKASPSEALSQLQSFAVNHPKLDRGEEDVDNVDSFLFVFRSSLYSDGSNYREYHRSCRGNERKSKMGLMIDHELKRAEKKRPADGSEASKLIFIRRKLVTMMTMLGSCKGGLSEEIRSKLEREMRYLMEKVSIMAAAL